MPNSYYNGGSFPATGSPATSASMRAELASITAGFDKLPALSGNAEKFIRVNSSGTALEASASLPLLNVTDSGFFIQDNGDATKQVQFQVSGVSTGTTRVLTVPDANFTLVGVDLAQTLTSKTLTTPVLSATAAGTAAGQLGYSGGVLSFGNGSATRTVVTLEDSQTVSGAKTFSGANTFSNTVSFSSTVTFTGANSFQNVSGQTFLASTTTTQDGVVITGRAGGSSSYRVTLSPATLSASRAITLPNSDGELVLDTATQTLTNKTISASSNTITGLIAQGATTLYVPSLAMAARLTNGAASGVAESTTNKVLLSTWDFDATTAEYVQFSVRMPKSWNEGTVTAYFLWSNASGTGNVVWAIQGLARSDDDVLDTAFGTAVTVADGVTAAGDLMQSAVTGAITIGGTPAENDWVAFQIYRDAANASDTLASDARLHGVVIIYTTNAATDA